MQAEKKSKRVRDMLSFLQGDVPRPGEDDELLADGAGPDPFGEPTKPEDDPEDADLNIEMMVPMGAKKQKGFDQIAQEVPQPGEHDMAPVKPDAFEDEDLPQSPAYPRKKRKQPLGVV